MNAYNFRAGRQRIPATLERTETYSNLEAESMNLLIFFNFSEERAASDKRNNGRLLFCVQLVEVIA
jgi:hypothetical protein